MNRRRNVYINSIAALICQMLQVLIGFVVRKIFISSLGMTYLGYNSVFSNILQLLNLADLGIGVAITSFLFKPIADGDKDRIAALMYIYRRVYCIMGVLVMVLGLIISIPLNILVPDANCSIGYLRGLFYINLVGTVSTYFMAYKRTLIIANQKSYIANIVDAAVFFIISGLQILSLLVIKEYVVFLILQIAKNIISNVILLVICDLMYETKSRENRELLLEEYRPQIKKYIKDVFVSRIGATIFYGTDNVIISVFKGSLLTAYLSNYTLVTLQITTVISQVLASLQATYGNYIHSGKSLEEQSKMTDNYLCVNFAVGNFCMVCFILLIQPFIEIVFGKDLLLPFHTVILIGINLFLAIMVQLPSQVFIIYKLFAYDRPVIIISAVLNILISSSLVVILGIDGVLIGTLITSLIYLFSRFYIISKYVFKNGYGKYIKKLCLYFTFSCANLLVAYGITNGDNIYTFSIVDFCIRLIYIVLLTLAITTFFISFTNEFIYLKDKFIPCRMKQIFSRATLGGGTAVLIVFGLVYYKYFFV